jgi:hypothetical protein
MTQNRPLQFMVARRMTGGDPSTMQIGIRLGANNGPSRRNRQPQSP